MLTQHFEGLPTRIPVMPRHNYGSRKLGIGMRHPRPHGNPTLSAPLVAVAVYRRETATFPMLFLHLDVATLTKHGVLLTGWHAEHPTTSPHGTD